ISPCPLATNIAAISYISYRINQRNILMFSGMVYTFGRSFTYIALGILIIKALIDIPVLSDFLQRYINKILGIILILVGMVLLDLLKLPLPSFSLSDKTSKRIAEKGIFGSLLLGVLFALAFCPVSAALFFGGLIPISIKAHSSIILPLIYGIGTALPVLFFAVLVTAGSSYISHFCQRLTKLEMYTNKFTGIIFICVGIYYALAYIFELI
ncbi:MAG: sulfite exporter TauE/SafE family protein, partial [Nitrospiraceae bacterium]